VKFDYLAGCVGFVMLLSGCGSGDGEKHSPEQCDQFMRAVCYRMQVCSDKQNGTSGAASDEFYDNCLSSFRVQGDCADFEESDSVDDCVNQMRSFACDVLLSDSDRILPATCQKLLDAWLK